MGETLERDLDLLHILSRVQQVWSQCERQVILCQKENIVLSIFAVQSTRGMSLGAGGGSRSLAGLSCLGGGRCGLNRGKRAGGAFF